MAGNRARGSAGHRIGRILTAPFRAVWQFGHWVRHSEEETEAVYGPNPNEISPEERVTKAAIILHGPMGGGGAAGSGF
jgi:hypothetical protein